MKTLLRAAAAVVVVMIGVGGCAKAAGSSGPTGVTCGTGTHNNGAGTCELDNALTLDNSVGSNYWACPNTGARGFYFFYLSLASNGSGSVWEPGETLGGVNAYQKYSISWQEGSATDQINVSANSYFDTLEQIVPSAAVGAQSFTAKAYKSGVLVYNVGCQLTLGTF